MPYLTPTKNLKHKLWFSRLRHPARKRSGTISISGTTQVITYLLTYFFRTHTGLSIHRYIIEYSSALKAITLASR